MGWKNKISGCFGAEDKEFALHASDTLRAAEMLKSACEENTGWAEYVAEIESWLVSQGCNAHHVAKQMERVKDIKNYLIYD